MYIHLCRRCPRTSSQLPCSQSCKGHKRWGGIQQQRPSCSACATNHNCLTGTDCSRSPHRIRKQQSRGSTCNRRRCLRSPQGSAPNRLQAPRRSRWGSYCASCTNNTHEGRGSVSMRSAFVLCSTGSRALYPPGQRPGGVAPRRAFNLQANSQSATVSTRAVTRRATEIELREWAGDAPGRRCCQKSSPGNLLPAQRQGVSNTQG